MSGNNCIKQLPANGEAEKVTIYTKNEASGRIAYIGRITGKLVMTLPSIDLVIEAGGLKKKLVGITEKLSNPLAKAEAEKLKQEEEAIIRRINELSSMVKPAAENKRPSAPTGSPTERQPTKNIPAPPVQSAGEVKLTVDGTVFTTRDFMKITRALNREGKWCVIFNDDGSTEVRSDHGHAVLKENKLVEGDMDETAANAVMRHAVALCASNELMHAMMKAKNEHENMAKAQASNN